jgi:hypothetical protein
MLEYGGVPIAQLTYLDARHALWPLCVTRSNKRQPTWRTNGAMK